MPLPRTIVVTGANRGIGQAICRLLLADSSSTVTPSKPLGPLRILATSRQGVDLGLSSTGTSAEVLYPRLDISSDASIASFKDFIDREIQSVHVLINNAGVNLETGQMAGIPDGQAGAAKRLELAKRTLDVNYFGTKKLTGALLPFMTTGSGQRPRIVNLSSVASTLSPYSAGVQSRFRNPDASVADLDRLAEDYLESVQESREEASGFSLPGRSYNVSKALINGLTSALARGHPDVLINACCPGWIATDMGSLVGSGRTKPPKSAEEGARIPVHLAVADIQNKSGRYWANANVRSKDVGEVQSW